MRPNLTQRLYGQVEMATFASDYSYGLGNEQKALAHLQTHLNTPLILRGGFHTFDYSNETETMNVELKSRRIPHNKYTTTIIGQNKMEYARNNLSNRSFVFAFYYTDGLYAIPYDPVLFDTFKKDDHYRRGFRPDTRNPEQKIVLIPTNLLVKICD